MKNKLLNDIKCLVDWYRPIVLKLLIILLLHSVFRFVFYWLNASSFAILSNYTLAKAMLHGIRFDLVAVMYANALWILYALMKDKKSKIISYFFVIANSLVFNASLIDWFYYPFVNKRLSVDFFGSVFDIQKHWMQDLMYYFGGVVVFVIIVFLLNWIYQRPTVKPALARLWIRIVSVVIAIPLMIIALRGGTQLRPITPVNANDNIESEAANLVQNSFFNLMQSALLPTLPDVQFYEPSTLKTRFNTTKQYHNATPLFAGKNIVLILVESLSKEYLNTYNPRYHITPFLDSLINISTSYPNFYANSKQSIKGNIAVLTSLPSLMDEPITTSKYQTNSLSGIPHYLKKIGYSSIYFHGAHNGSFNLESLAYRCGFQQYYGMDQYPSKTKDYDGNWGIWDAPFLQQMSTILDTFSQPFFATAFTLNNHHPYSLPNNYKSKSEVATPHLKTVEYTDYALQQFFETSKTKPWFNETVFIITGDHTGPFADETNNTQINNYQIPLIVYQPNTPKMLIDSTLMQQIDIMPLILSEAGYSAPFHSFGKIPTDTSIQNLIYQYLPPFFVINEQSINYLKLEGGALTSSPSDTNQVLLKQDFKAILQTFYDEVKHNKLTIDHE